jgi:Rad3-related DNA helicase
MHSHKLVFFFDEAHLLFENASKVFLDEIQRVATLEMLQQAASFSHVRD